MNAFFIFLLNNIAIYFEIIELKIIYFDYIATPNALAGV